MPKSKSMCSGCYNNFYNLNREGGCWSFAKAKIVKRFASASGSRRLTTRAVPRSVSTATAQKDTQCWS